MADACCTRAPGAAPIQGASSRRSRCSYMEANSIIQRWGKRYDGNVLRALMSMPEITAAEFEDAE